MTSKVDEYRNKAAEYERLADAAADPEAKKRLRDLANESRRLADAAK
jgi:hypothetical protein